MWKADLDFNAECNIKVEELRRQYGLRASPRTRVAVERPCTLDDGVESANAFDVAAPREQHREAATQGRWSKFIPASGVAARMFSFRSFDEKEQLCRQLHHFAFFPNLREYITGHGKEVADLVKGEKFDNLISSVLDSDGLGYEKLPKGLIPFHDV